MSSGLQYTNEQIIEALEAVHGAVYLAADRIGCSYKTIQRRAKQVKAVEEVIDKYRNRRVDMAELVIDNALAKGDLRAAMFVLNTLGKNRGYAERQEITGADGESLKVVIEYVGSDWDNQ